MITITGARHPIMI